MSVRYLVCQAASETSAVYVRIASSCVCFDKQLLCALVRNMDLVASRITTLGGRFGSDLQEDMQPTPGASSSQSIPEPAGDSRDHAARVLQRLWRARQKQTHPTEPGARWKDLGIQLEYQVCSSSVLTLPKC